jgi:hypothetical protein
VERPRRRKLIALLSTNYGALVPENARQLHQLRDLLVTVEDPGGGGTGLGNAETFALGEFPERGHTAQNSFL